MEPAQFKEDKARLRKTVKNRLSALSSEEFSASGAAAARQLPQIPRWDEFRSVLLFFSMTDEIDTRPITETILDAGKSLFFPRIEGENLVFYKSGSLLALKPEDFPVLVITPGLAFDLQLNRLGRGKGYYDRFFASLDAENRNYTALGLCMECQLAKAVPAEPWDKKMDLLLTENRIIKKR